jgi:uncharacterized protein YjgD (DUF1641 family)
MISQEELLKEINTSIAKTRKKENEERVHFGGKTELEKSLTDPDVGEFLKSFTI